MKKSDWMEPDGKIHIFLSRERSMATDGSIYRRPLKRFVNECAELLGLQQAKTAKTPGSKSLIDIAEDVVPASAAEHTLYRTCVG